jgi:hypothetical protein
MQRQLALEELVPEAVRGREVLDEPRAKQHPHEVPEGAAVDGQEQEQLPGQAAEAGHPMGNDQREAINNKYTVR